MDEAARKFCMRIAHARRCPLTGNDLFADHRLHLQPASSLLSLKTYIWLYVGLLTLSISADFLK